MIQMKKQGDKAKATVVNERGTWQHCLSRFLQGGLKLLPKSTCNTLLKDSSQLIDAFMPLHHQKVFYISLDIKDLYFALEPELLFLRLKQKLVDNSLLFQNSFNMSIYVFLDLVKLYLSSTVIDFNDELYIQNKGVCIGSSIAPFLADIYLEPLDNFCADLASKTSVTIKRYVDDFVLLAFNKTVLHEVVDNIISSNKELLFQVEDPLLNDLQFLDLVLSGAGSKFCWKYGNGKNKPLLSAYSAHSKIVKRSVVSSCILNAMSKSCNDLVFVSINLQIQRLLNVGYDFDFLISLWPKILKKVFSGNSGSTDEFSKKPFVVLPYYHNFSHCLLKIAAKFNVKIVFKIPFKLSNLTPFSKSFSNFSCPTKHRSSLITPCQCNVVYLIPFSCGSNYVGEN